MDVFAALADPVRRDLLRRVARGPARVVDLAAEHPISRPAISRHLRVLAAAELVAADDVGRERHYRIRAEPLADVMRFVAGLTAEPPIPESALDALDTEVRRTTRQRRAAREPAAREETA